jgi:hypothetical protein
MPYGAHIHGHSRTCGATTVVKNQTTVYVNNKLWAVEGDPNSHGNGDLVPVTGDTVFIQNILVIVHGPDNAFPDDLCIPLNHQHCTPFTAQGSSDTLVY